MKSEVRSATAMLAFLAVSCALLLFGTRPADATLVFDGESMKAKPATLTGFHEYLGRKGELETAKLLIGGPDAKPGDYGHIEWTQWTKNRAVGFGTGWHLGKMSYDSEVGANPWNGGRIKVKLHRKKGLFTRLSIMQRTSWRSETEQGKCDYFLSFVYKPPRNRAHPWMQMGIGGGWPLKKQPCFGVRVS